MRWGGDREDEKRRWRRTVRGGMEIGKNRQYHHHHHQRMVGECRDIMIMMSWITKARDISTGQRHPPGMQHATLTV